MSVSNFKANASKKAEFENVVLDEGVYQCVIDKVEMSEKTKYMSTEKAMQLTYYLKPLNAGEQFKDKILFYNTSTSFFNGKSTKAGSGLKASNLYLLIKAIYKFYKPEVDVDAMDPEEITDQTINELEGKQVMAMVKTIPENERYPNKVISLSAIKAEITAATTVDQTTADLEKAIGIS